MLDNGPPRRDSLRAFLSDLAAADDLARIADPVSVVNEMTAVGSRVLRAGGPALRFEAPVLADGSRAEIPVIANLFGTRARVAAGLGCGAGDVSELGEFLAALRAPAPVTGMRDALSRWPMLRAALRTRPRFARTAPVQQVVDEAPDLTRLPVQTCWPGDAGPLITWPVVMTRPHGSAPDAVHAYNAGVYRAQVLDGGRVILRWLAHRGGAAHHRTWERATQAMPVAIALGADPATLLAAALPLPEAVSELTFSGVLRGARAELVPARTVPLLVPAQAEMVIEGWIHPGDTAPEGPFGDHTGYYNAAELFPVMRVSALTHRRDPLYLSTHTGRPPDEPSVIGEVFNDLALPVIRAQIPELRDLWLPPAACSYRIAVVSIDKRYPGQARRVMMALWGMLAQFSYTKMIVVVDEDINPRDWDDVAWAMSTRMDPGRDVMILENTPMDYLDFASPQAGLAGKMGIDATTKIGTESGRDWGQVMTMPDKADSFAADLLARAGLS
ncbi:UbiD family decarboxylase [Sediminimonas qiaohouensis]|uniref:UbiD family decarboxylase n=1 Tax=Sediminimonas qiaohouensis TaxID=552061 RepID=UPI00040CDE93|nr:UbiD family decarboxylase [Sediminimonas qiaohouensis]